MPLLSLNDFQLCPILVRTATNWYGSNSDAAAPLSVMSNFSEDCDKRVERKCFGEADFQLCPILVRTATSTGVPTLLSSCFQLCPILVRTATMNEPLVVVFGTLSVMSNFSEDCDIKMRISLRLKFFQLCPILVRTATNYSFRGIPF